MSNRNASADERAMFRRYIGEIPHGTSDADVIRACKAIVAAKRNQAGHTLDAALDANEGTPDEALPKVPGAKVRQ